MTRALSTKWLSLILTDSRGDPDAALTVHRKTVGVRLTGPDRFITEVGRRFGRLRVANRQLHLTRRVAHRIDYRQIIRGRFERSVDRPVRIHRWVPFVARDLIMQ